MTLLSPFVALLLAVWPSHATLLATSSPTTTSTKGSANVTAKDEDKAQVLQAYRNMYGAMLDGRTDQLDLLLDDQYSLTHMTGRLQPKREWLAAIDSGEMRYHKATEKSVTVDVTGSTAVLVGRNVVTATIYGAHRTWNVSSRRTTSARTASGSQRGPLPPPSDVAPLSRANAR